MTGLVGRLVGGLASRMASGLAERTQSDARWSPSVKVALRQAWLDHRDRARRGDALPDASSTGFRIFSQFEEDGIVLYLLASLRISSARRRPR